MPDLDPQPFPLAPTKQTFSGLSPFLLYSWKQFTRSRGETGTQHLHWAWPEPWACWSPLVQSSPVGCAPSHWPKVEDDCLRGPSSAQSTHAQSVEKGLPRCRDEKVYSRVAARARAGTAGSLPAFPGVTNTCRTSSQGPPAHKCGVSSSWGSYSDILEGREEDTGGWRCQGRPPCL